MMKTVADMLSSFFAWPKKKAKKNHSGVSLPSGFPQFHMSERSRDTALFLSGIFTSAAIQRGKKVAVSVMFAMVLSSCGYHLVGHGDDAGAIPEDVTAVSVQATGKTANTFLSGLKHQFERSDRFKVIDAESVIDETSHAVIRIEQASEFFVPSTYDQSGIATQYRMTIRGNIRLYRADRLIWESGLISKSGDVFVTGGPTGLEASRKRILDDLRSEWIFAAWSRIGSGF
ncbi:MAG: adenosylmethionine-8-amino-7-oxononanoate aminotransferase [Mariprofundaceae bacterium]